MSNDVEKIVQSRYGAAAQSGLSSERDDVRQVAVAFGYSEDDLRSIPADANMGLSCGNPLAFASLKPGEVVVDLGSGGGLDVFLAAQKVGPTGRAIGIDMTREMVELARRNAIKSGGGQAPANVKFHLAMIDDLPLDADSVDCIISNCVINLSADKHAVFREMARVLKPGGRMAISDIALKKAIPPEVGQDILAYVGCVAGAIPIEEYRQGLIDAGFSAVEIVDTKADLNVYSKIEGQSVCCTPRSDNLGGCCGPSGGSHLPVVTQSTQDFHERLAELLRKYDVNDFAASVKVYAVKPRSAARVEEPAMFRRELNVLAVLAALVGAGAVPVHPETLNDRLQRYVADRIGEFENIPQERRDDLRKLAAYLHNRAKAHQPARLTFICTHNSRRSQICQIWAATAAAYYGRTGVEVYSGGTEVTSFNARAVSALRRAGFVIDEPKTTQNPHFRVRFCAAGPELECFSKFYRDASNSKADFCAVMTCSQADKQCPIVQGAATRLSLPFDDPKVFDNTAQEPRKYDERCEQIARELLFVFSRLDN